MDTEAFSLRWEDEEDTGAKTVGKCDEIITDDIVHVKASFVKTETKIEDTDQTAAENLMYLSQDVSYADHMELTDDGMVECVTEEVITDDWVVPGGQERVEVPFDHLAPPLLDSKEDNDIDVPLPTDQDEYAAMRPWPCDFCSRRFRKKAALMNHMVAHQNDRPHACNLCGVRYVRKCDLMNHLKVHAYVPDLPDDNVDYDDVLDNQVVAKPKKKRGRRRKVQHNTLEDEEEMSYMTSARTQQWSGRGRARPRSPRAPSPAPSPSPSPAPSPPPPAAPPSPPPPADPSRPFVCLHCGVGFAREKALQSHSRIHGGDSPLECNVCGELCWSREALTTHMRRRHPHVPDNTQNHVTYDDTEDSEEDIEFKLSPQSESGSRAVYDTVRGPELFCQHCGVAFQRADLLRRHVTAAHSYKQRVDSSGHSGSWTEHTCDVCGETCADALQLLAHAEGHADRHHITTNRFKKTKGRNHNHSYSSGSKQFPCKVCGKVFGSRSSQQIHVRIHTGERPYACRFCWKAFADGGTLRKHERIHTGEKPYACAVCPRAFNQRVVLREHIRSHHSAPDRRANGSGAYCCVVCGRTLHSSGDLVQHLIQHSDANTAMKRKPQCGPRKYKRRKKLIKNEEVSPPRSSSSSPAPPPPPAPPARAKMIHTQPDTRPRTKQVRHRRPPRHPAADLLAITPHLPPSPPAPAPPSPSALEPRPSSDGAYRCEMCNLRFDKRDELLLHVPIHI